MDARGTSGRVAAMVVLVVLWAATAGAYEGPTDAVGELVRGEYAFSFESGRLQAPNRAHGLRTWIDGAGVEIVPRERPEAPSGASLRLTLSSLRRGPVREAVEEGVVIHDGHRAEIRRRAVTEWFVNDVDGLKHGIDIPAPPLDGRGDLVLVYEIGDDVLASASGPEAVTIRTAAGDRWLRYSGLVVLDAAGEAVPARIRVDDGAIEIVVADADATYPLTVDPLLQNATWKQEGNQASAYVGAASSTAGDVNGDGYSDILVAAYGYDNGQSNEGRVWVVYGGPSGPGGTPTILESNQAGAQFGFSIGAAGDVDGDGYDDFLVGANLYDTTLTNAGAVWLYLGGPSGPTFGQRIEGDQAFAELGRSAATAGDVNGDGFDDIVLGAYGYDAGQGNEGRAYVHHGNASGVDKTANWFVDGNQTEARLGVSVSTAGDTNGDGYADVLVGAYLYDNGQTDEGAAWVYLGGPAGLSTTAAWTQDGDWPGGRFGFSVGPAGDVDGDGYADIVVGAYLTDFSLNDEGAAFVYLGGPGGPSLSRHVSWYGGQAGANLGRSVFTAGDVNGDGYADVAVGAPGYDTSSGGQGRVLVYHGSAAGLSTTPDWVEDGDAQASEFGKGVATAGDVDGDGYSDLMVGDPTYDNGQTNEGISRVYLGSGDGLSTSRATRQGTVTSADLGRVVASAGDVNGDGFSDVLASVNGSGVVQFQAYYGGAAGLPSSPSWIATNPPGVSQQHGDALASAGDVNGDGYDDVLVADPLYTGDVYREGRVALYLGSASGIQATAYRLFVGDSSEVRFGESVASAGDVNGDGYADVIIGAPDYFFTDGAAFVYHGGPSGPDSTTPSTTIRGDLDALGNAVASAGDVDGDGYSDVVLCRRDDRRAFVYPGSASGVRVDSPWTLTPASGGSSCTHVAPAGDVNGDGYADVAYGDTVAERVYVFHGSSSGPSATPNRTYVSGQSGGSELGPVASAGDIDNDGFSDLLIGESTFDGAGGSSSGRARLHLGSSSGVAASAAWTDDGDQPSAFFGRSVASAGDVNGDGFSDVLVGEPGWDSGSNAAAGRFHLYLGGGGDGLDRIPRQQRPAGTSEPPIAMLGKSPDGSRIRLRSRARSAAGRTRVRVQYEVRPWSSSYTGQATHLSSELLSSAPASDGSRLNYSSPISGLAPGERYKWRLRFLGASPYFPRTPWMHLQGNGVHEWTVRTDCTAATWYRDADGDTFGDPAVPISTCDADPPGYVGNDLDCDDGNGDVWGVPGEIATLAVDDDGIVTTLSWAQPADPGASPGAWAYDVLRSDEAATFTDPSTTVCLATDVAVESATDAEDPGAGTVFHYVVRAGTVCGEGSLGQADGGGDRPGLSCP